MKFILTRVDNRLVHGQILEGWVPFLKISCIVIANDEVAGDLFRSSVIRMAVSRNIEVRMHSVEEFSKNYTYDDMEGERAIVLFGNIEDAVRAYGSNFKFKILNIGNIHGSDDKMCFNPSISLNENDIENLVSLVDSGVKVEIRCLPTDRPVDFHDVADKIKS
jgi:PTS system mannose-specific IIB component